MGCNSTKKAQVELIEGLFKKYGPVWVSKPNNKGVQSVDTLLNSSFSFLLPKEDKINRWITINKSYFSAYLAGYTDAEGCIKIYDGRARFRIGSYDIGILRELTRLLRKFKITTNLRKESTAGFIDKRGLIHRGDFWRMSVNNKGDLLKLFSLIRPYSKHADKIRDINLATHNVQKRIKIFDK